MKSAARLVPAGMGEVYRARVFGSDLTNSPTLTLAATQAGVSLGTAAYMSPEQARGKAADKRADIWAFGAVLYEMLTGRAAFARDTVSDTIAAILDREPDDGGADSGFRPAQCGKCVANWTARLKKKLI